MTTSELAAVGFVRRLLESARERAAKVDDQELRAFLCARLEPFDEACKKETLRRKQDLSKLGGMVLRVMPACSPTELRATLAAALTTCQLILPHLPEWAIAEVRHAESHCKESIRDAGSDAE